MSFWRATYFHGSSRKRISCGEHGKGNSGVFLSQKNLSAKLVIELNTSVAKHGKHGHKKARHKHNSAVACKSVFLMSVFLYFPANTSFLAPCCTFAGLRHAFRPRQITPPVYGVCLKMGETMHCTSLRQYPKREITSAYCMLLN